MWTILKSDAALPFDGAKKKRRKCSRSGLRSQVRSFPALLPAAPERLDAFAARGVRRRLERRVGGVLHELDLDALQASLAGAPARQK